MCENFARLTPHVRASFTRVINTNIDAKICLLARGGNRESVNPRSRLEGVVKE